MWFSIVYTLIDNDTRHRSGQNVVDSQGSAEWVQQFDQIRFVDLVGD